MEYKMEYKIGQIVNIPDNRTGEVMLSWTNFNGVESVKVKVGLFKIEWHEKDVLDSLN